MVLYSSGVLMIFATFVFLYRHAWKKREQLDLSPAAEIDLRYGQRAHLISATLGAVSVALSLVMPPRYMWIPGVMYMLMGPLHAWNGMQTSRAQDRLTKAATVADAKR
jgi:hypothetical protein